MDVYVLFYKLLGNIDLVKSNQTIETVSYEMHVLKYL